MPNIFAEHVGPSRATFGMNGQNGYGPEWLGPELIRARMARTWEFRARKNGGFDASALATIRDETGADWMITWARFELPDPPVAAHGNFVIIDLQAYDLEQPAN